MKYTFTPPKRRDCFYYALILQTLLRKYKVQTSHICTGLRNFKFDEIKILFSLFYLLYWCERNVMVFMIHSKKMFFTHRTCSYFQCLADGVSCQTDSICTYFQQQQISRYILNRTLLLVQPLLGFFLFNFFFFTFLKT